MVRVLMGFNKTFTVRRRLRSATDTGSYEEMDATVVAANVPGTVQPHVLSNLPPPPQRPKSGGLLRMDEWRIWLGDTTNAVDVRQDDLIEEDGTSPLRVYRVLAVLNEAGRDHHQYIRAESYSQESNPWVTSGGEG